MNGVVYADFTCPASYLASLRLDRLLAAGAPAPEWRAVEHRPRLPFEGLHLQTSARTTRAAEVAAVRALLAPGEVFPATVPRHLPHPRPAVVAYAEACGAGVADLVRPLLFHAYWVEGEDIGDPEVLRRLLPPALVSARHTGDPVQDFGFAVTAQRGPVTTRAYRRMVGWQRGWLELAGPVALTLHTKLGTWTGAQALQRLAPVTRGIGTAADTTRGDHAAPALAGRP